MTIHGIYIKTNVNGKWHLFSTVKSPEAANKEIAIALQAAKDQGGKIYEVAMREFPTNFYIPHMLNNIEHADPRLN